MRVRTRAAALLLLSYTSTTLVAILVRAARRPLCKAHRSTRLFHTVRAAEPARKFVGLAHHLITLRIFYLAYAEVYRVK